MVGMSDLRGLLPIDDAGRIDSDLACAQCGYNLRGALPRGDCPECGAAVSAAIERGRKLRRESNTLLMTASGMGWLIAAGIASICCALLLAVEPWVPMVGWLALPGIVTIVIGVPIGLWLVTEPQADNLNNLRRLVRLSMIATPCGVVLLLLGISVAIAWIEYVVLLIACTGLFSFGGAIYALSRSVASVGGVWLQRQLRFVGLLVFAVCLSAIVLIIVAPFMSRRATPDAFGLIVDVAGMAALILLLWLLPLLFLVRQRVQRIAGGASEGRFG
jgi:hypothetical protein